LRGSGRISRFVWLPVAPLSAIRLDRVGVVRVGRRFIGGEPEPRKRFFRSHCIFLSALALFVG
jgi:hypothetical protein